MKKADGKVFPLCIRRRPVIMRSWLNRLSQQRDDGFVSAGLVGGDMGAFLGVRGTIPWSLTGTNMSEMA